MLWVETKNSPKDTPLQKKNTHFIFNFSDVRLMSTASCIKAYVSVTVLLMMIIQHASCFSTRLRNNSDLLNSRPEKHGLFKKERKCFPKLHKTLKRLNKIILRKLYIHEFLFRYFYFWPYLFRVLVHLHHENNDRKPLKKYCFLFFFCNSRTETLQESVKL